MFEGIDVLMYGLAFSAMALWLLTRRTGQNLGGNFAPEAARLMQTAFTLAHVQKDTYVEVAHIMAALTSHPIIALELSRRGLSPITFTQNISQPAETQDTVDTRWGPDMTALFTKATLDAKRQKLAAIDLRTLLAAILETDTDVARTLLKAGVSAAHLSQTGEPASGQSFVYVWNDPKTSMEHVSNILQEHFELTEGAAYTLMLSTHINGFAALGPYPHREAEQRIEAATETTFTSGFALCLSLEAPNTQDWVSSHQGFLPAEKAAA